MNKLLSLVAVAFFFSISTLAFATGWNWGQNPSLGSGGSGWFNGNVSGSASAHGYGTQQFSKTYATHEQMGNMDIQAIRTAYGAGTPCQGACAENMATGQFNYLQKVATGGISEVIGSNRASSFTDGNVGGSFDFKMILQGLQ